MVLVSALMASGCAKVASAKSLNTPSEALATTSSINAVVSQMKCSYIYNENSGVPPTEYNYSLTVLVDGSQIMACNRDRTFGTMEIVVSANTASVNGKCEIGSHANPDSTFLSDGNGGMTVKQTINGGPTFAMTCATQNF